MNPTVTSLSLVALLAAVAAGGRAAIAAPIDLALTGQFRVLVKDAPVDGARVYRSLQPPAAFLVSTALFARPVFVSTAPRTARLVDPARLTYDGGDPDLVRLDPTGPQEGFFSVHVEGPRLVMERDGIRLALAPREPLLGERTLDALTAELPEYRRGASRYGPDPRAMAALRQMAQPVDLLVFFGSWCPHCEQVLPRLVRVLDELPATSVRATFRGLPPDEGADPVADRYGIGSLPTAVVSRSGREIARLAGDAWDAPERALVTALGLSGGGPPASR